MTRQVAWLVVLLACSCSGRRGTYIVGAEGGPPTAGPESGSGGANDAGGATDAGADATDGGDAGMVPACVNGCATLLLVGCKYDDMNDCLHACTDTRGAYPACASEYDAFNACAAKQPLSHYYCDVDGFAALDPSYCTAEMDAFKTCRHAQ